MKDGCLACDISDQSWAEIEDMLPGRKGTWGGNARNNRQFINAVFWVLRTGAPWRHLPPIFGDWKNIHRRFCRWRDRGIWERLLVIWIDQPEFDVLFINAIHAKSCLCGGSARCRNQAKDKTTGGAVPRYPWPWMRLVCRSESLMQKVPLQIMKQLKK